MGNLELNLYGIIDFRRENPVLSSINERYLSDLTDIKLFPFNTDNQTGAKALNPPSYPLEDLTLEFINDLKEQTQSVMSHFKTIMPHAQSFCSKPVNDKSEKNKKLDSNKTFDKIMEYVFKDESGFVNHPKDPGGATNKGICLKWYNANMGTNLSIEEFKNLSDEDAKKYYKKFFWEASGAKKLADEGNEQLSYVVFDTAIHQGIGKAKRLLAQSQGNAEEMLNKRLTALKQCKNWSTFGKGWTARLDRIENRLECFA